MKIAIDISPLSSGHKVRGVGSYVSLLKNNIEKYDKKNNYIFFDKKVPKDADVVHYPYFDPYFPVLPLFKKYKTVVTVHDLIPIKYSDKFPSGIKGKLKWEYNKILLKGVDAVIADSKASKKDVIRLVGVSEEKVQVGYLAADSRYKKIDLSEKEKETFSKKYNLPDKFFLYVGDVTWNKNLPALVRAFKKTPYNLVLAGKALGEKEFDTNNPWNLPRAQMHREMGSGKQFSVLGFISDEDLVSIYNMALCLVMPSLDEGFGLPVLEAMQSGCPVITSLEGSLPEVGGDAVEYVDANSELSIASSLKKVYEDKELRLKLSEKGLIQAKKFDIESSMKSIISAYERI